MATVDDLLHDARGRLRRFEPHEAAAALADGALFVDIRPEADRRREGEIEGAVVVERIVFEWRLDPESDHRLPQVRDHDQPVVVICNEGYSSSLAAATLQDMGFTRATDLVGGFRAWGAAGLPVKR